MKKTISSLTVKHNNLVEEDTVINQVVYYRLWNRFRKQVHAFLNCDRNYFITSSIAETIQNNSIMIKLKFTPKSQFLEISKDDRKELYKLLNKLRRIGISYHVKGDLKKEFFIILRIKNKGQFYKLLITAVLKLNNQEEILALKKVIKYG